MMKMTAENRQIPPWEKLLIGFCLVFFLCALFIGIQIGFFVYRVGTDSRLIIWNESGSDVRFEKVIVDGNNVLQKPRTLIVPKTNVERSLSNRQQEAVTIVFQAPKRKVELTLVVIGNSQEGETVSSILDNTSRPCSFQAYYYKGQLVCGDCERISVR
jgi:hypothetical protein